MFELRYSERARRDIMALDANAAREIRHALELKLMVAPEAFGKPLRHSLNFLRVLRVGDWRVLYQLSGETVRIITTRNRKKGYRGLG